MKTWKRALALVLALVMALSLVALPSFAEGEETGGGTETTQPEWPNEGAIRLNKEAKPVQGKDGVYEITLTIEGMNYKTTSDVVLVIDKSGSMNDDNKLWDTKKAAIAFGEKLLTKGSTTRIAIVTYAETAASINNGHFYTADELDAFKSQINGIKASGGTNQQAGIHVAQQLLVSDSPAGNLKNIVILSDGEPTYSYRFSVPQRGDVPATPAPDYTKVIGNGSNFGIYTPYTGSARGNAGYFDWGIYYSRGSYTYNADGTFTFKSDVNTNNGVATIWEANQAKAAGTTIFSVALQAGTDGENTLKSCATDPTKGYYAIGQNDDVETKLKDAFTAIAGSIAIAAKNGTVVDPMSDHVSLNFEGDPTVTSNETDYNNGRADVYLSQGTVTRDGKTLNWRVGNINEGTPAVMKYRVKLNDDVVSGQTYPTNKQTTFTYTDYQDHEASKDFPIPEVTPGGGTIRMHFYLVNDQGQPINREGVEVDSPDKAAELTLEEYFLYEGNKALNYGAYQVAKKDISGYTYYGYTLNGRDAANPDVQGREDTVSVEITSTNANREVWFAYYQTFNVAHVRMDKSGNAQQVGEIDTYPVSASFNLTEKVNKKADGSAVTAGGYLYGGAFSNKDCTKAYSFADGETGLSFVPQAGATYYIWEVPDAYLKPVTLSCWEHNTNGKLDVIGFYMVSGIDREYYKQVGFMLNSAKTVADQRTLTYQDNTTKVVQLTSGQSAAFEQIVLKQKDGNTRTYNVSNAVKGYDKGYMVCYGVEQGVWKIVNAENTYSPYWITLDGVKVTSATARTVKYQGEGSSRLNYSEKSDNVGYEAASVSAETQLLTLASYCADGTPITADVPTVENVTVTVVDAAKTYELTVSAGTGIRDQVAYQAPAGKVFAGWFADQAYTTPADLDQVTQDTTIYAKYVSDSYLDLNYSRIGLFRLRGVTLISAVDNPANYQASGFIVGDQKVDASYASRYRIFKTPANLFGAARDAKLMLADKSLSGTGDLEVTPYWITLDGTEVHGVTHTLHYNTRTIWE